MKTLQYLGPSWPSWRIAKLPEKAVHVDAIAHGPFTLTVKDADGRVIGQERYTGVPHGVKQRFVVPTDRPVPDGYRLSIVAL